MSKRPWYGYWMPRYDSDEPNYFDSNQFDWAKLILSKRELIKAELQKVLQDRNGMLFPYYSPAVSTDGAQWHTLAFITWGIEVKENLKKYPQIAEIVESIPQLVSASVNVLMPGAKLQLHQGDSDSFYRCHLGIEIPTGLPDLGFEVEGEKKAWDENDILIFLDAKEHCAWNNSDKRRVIFSFDIIKDEYMDQKTRICLNVRSFLMLQWISGKYPGFLKWNRKIHRVIFLKIKFLLWLLHPYQKKKGVIIKHS